MDTHAHTGGARVEVVPFLDMAQVLCQVEVRAGTQGREHELILNGSLVWPRGGDERRRRVEGAAHAKEQRRAVAVAAVARVWLTDAPPWRGMLQVS